jgi:hypothetical protein
MVRLPRSSLSVILSEAKDLGGGKVGSRIVY